MQPALRRRFCWYALCLATLAGLGGCASSGDPWMSASVVAVAVVDGRVLRGTANFTSEHEGTVQLQEVAATSLSCFGPLRHTGSVDGVIDLSCNNGQSVQVPFRTLGLHRMAGRGVMGGSEFALAIGLSAAQAGAYLALTPEQQGLSRAGAPASGADL